MIDLPKYPRTLHLEGSKGTVDKDAVPFSHLRGSYLVVEEKMDGSMVAIGFDSSANVHVFHRNKEVSGEEFDKLKSWLSHIEDRLFDILEDRYILYGEWMFACHTIFYDKLPSYFIEYDIYDKQEKIWLSTKARNQMLFGLPIISAKILDSGIFNNEREITELLLSSSFISFENKNSAILEFERIGLCRGDALSRLDLSGLPEGLYIKHENESQVLGRYKYIRKDFIDTILRSEHWSKRPIIKNRVVA